MKETLSRLKVLVGLYKGFLWKGSGALLSNKLKMGICFFEVSLLETNLRPLSCARLKILWSAHHRW